MIETERQNDLVLRGYVLPGRTEELRFISNGKKMPSSIRASYDSCLKHISFSNLHTVIPFTPIQFDKSNVVIPVQFNKSNIFDKEMSSFLQIKQLDTFP